MDDFFFLPASWCRLNVSSIETWLQRHILMFLGTCMLARCCPWTQSQALFPDLLLSWAIALTFQTFSIKFEGKNLGIQDVVAPVLLVELRAIIIYRIFKKPLSNLLCWTNHGRKWNGYQPQVAWSDLICLQLGLLCCLSHWVLGWQLVNGQKGEGRCCARHASRGW